MIYNLHVTTFLVKQGRASFIYTRMIKNFILLMILFFMSQPAFAKVIELDNHNIAHCQEQLKNDDWVQNVLMLYVKGSPETNKFRTFYEQISTEYPKRHLFALNVFDPKADAKENQLIWKTVKGCLTDIWHEREESMGGINPKTSAVLLYDYRGAKVGKLLTKKDIFEFMDEKSESK